MPQLVPGVPLQLMVPVHVHVFKCVLRHSALPRWDSPQLAPGGLSARYSSHTVSMRTHEKKVACLLLVGVNDCEVCSTCENTHATLVLLLAPCKLVTWLLFFGFRLSEACGSQQYPHQHEEFKSRSNHQDGCWRW